MHRKQHNQSTLHTHANPFLYSFQIYTSDSIHLRCSYPSDSESCSLLTHLPKPVLISDDLPLIDFSTSRYPLPLESINRVIGIIVPRSCLPADRQFQSGRLYPCRDGTPLARKMVCLVFS